MALLHIFAVVSPTDWTTRVADELRSRIGDHLNASVHLTGRGISILAPVDSERSGRDALRTLQDAAKDIEVKFSDDSLPGSFQRVRITLEFERSTVPMRNAPG